MINRPHALHEQHSAWSVFMKSWKKWDCTNYAVLIRRHLP